MAATVSSFFESRKNTAGPKLLSQRAAQPWVEKYRPKCVEDIAYQEEVVAVLKKSIESDNLPHLLFYGPPGTGKTSTILAIARQLFGPELLKTRVLELNASDERGINVVREKVKEFAQISSHVVSHGVGKKTPPYKIIILDEADSMTVDAQSALRRTMEQYSKITRFCLICNYVSRIIDPLASRCAKFRFKPLTITAIEPHLTMICQQESLKVEPSALSTLSFICRGDLRKAITLLQSVQRFKPDTTITASDIEEADGTLSQDVVEQLFDLIIKGSFESLDKYIRDMLMSGYPASFILESIHSTLVTETRFTDVTKARLLVKLAEIECCLVDGSDEYLQLADFSFYAMNELQPSQ